MSKFLKIIIIIFLSLLLCAGIIWFVGFRFYNSVFRLSFDQVTTSLENTPTQCKKFTDCKLLPGDIILRRYITPTTIFFDEILDPYFTHSVFYLSDDEIFEAVGNYPAPEDQILISKLSKSDWLNADMDNFVIVRPKNYSGKLDYIVSELKTIANDPEYIFGPLKEGQKKVSCSDVILKYLSDEKIILNLPNIPKIITPDYLFWVTEKDRSNFEIVGYNINQKFSK